MSFRNLRRTQPSKIHCVIHQPHHKLNFSAWKGEEEEAYLRKGALALNSIVCSGKGMWPKRFTPRKLPTVKWIFALITDTKQRNFLVFDI